MNKIIPVGEPVTLYTRRVCDAFELERIGVECALWFNVVEADMAQQMFKCIREDGFIYFERETMPDGSITIYGALSVMKLQAIPKVVEE